MERELPWPPERPPERGDVVEAWQALKHEVMRYLKREVQKGDTRAFMKKLDSTHLDVWIATHEQHAERVVEDVKEEGDLRPIFGDGSYLEELEEMEEADDDEGKPEDDSGEQEHGDLAVVGEGAPYEADTRFCLWMLFRHKTFEEHGEMGVSEVIERRINVPPDTALYLLGRVKHWRKTIADALVFRFIKNNAESEADDEMDDGNVFPAWRDRHSDPAMDAILLCTDLQRLYAEMVGDDDHDA